MTGSLSPEQLEQLMAGYVLCDLSPEEAENFRQLLTNNPQLATEVNRLQEALELLPYALPEVEPPPHLRSAILDAASEEISRDRPRKIYHLPWSKIVASAAALVAIALGLNNYRLWQVAQSQQTVIARLQQELKIAQSEKNTIEAVLYPPTTRIFFLKGTTSDKSESASGRILLNPDQHKAVIVFQNLPTPPADQIYRLWAIVDNQKIPCANFSVSQQGTVLNEFSIPATACSSTKSTLAVTLEPSSLPPQPVGPIVMVEGS
ncbi:MAG TPA: hypothetical protein DEG47_31355 [Cyanobacteria bacterium UBA11148]|nr:hypothetical protein [Cyanobacteria bacterium UBA11148]